MVTASQHRNPATFEMTKHWVKALSLRGLTRMVAQSTKSLPFKHNTHTSPKLATRNQETMISMLWILKENKIWNIWTMQESWYTCNSFVTNTVSPTWYVQLQTLEHEPHSTSMNTSTKWGISDYVTKDYSHHRFFKLFTTKYEQFWLTQL